MNTVRPLLLTASETGGAGTATRRIHNGLREIDIDSQMLVRDKSTDDPTIHGPESRFAKAIAMIRPLIDELPLHYYGSPPEFSLSWPPDRLKTRVEDFDPDVVHLNWVARGFMSPESIASFDCPVVWRLPDMWPLTGGCHYAENCTRYRSECGNCPQLNSGTSWDPTRLTLKRKKRAVEKADLTVVATTSWLAECASESTIFENSPIETIPNGLNTDIFKPLDEKVGREMFKLPSEPHLILFGAVSPLGNPRKGYDLIVDALSRLDPDLKTDVELVVFGTSKPENAPDFGFPTHYTGYLSDEESLALLYSAVDVMVVPSRYEGFGQTVTEAMASGTPVVGFDTTGPGEIIDHMETGYLASKFDSSDLARGIEWVLSDQDRQRELEGRARSMAVSKYDYVEIAEQYRDLYESVVETNSPASL